MASPRPEPSSESPPRVVRPTAVIDIGTTSIRMAVAEIDNHGGVRTVATLAQAVNIGRETFTKGLIGKDTTEECVRILRDYKYVLSEHQITRPDQIRVVATSGVREASNRLAFIDRVYIATGLQVETIDEAEESRVTYLSIVPLLQAEPEIAGAKTVVVEAGGGGTDVLVIRNGNVLFSHSYRLGALRLRETLEAFHAPAGKVRAMMESQIRRTVAQVREQVWQEGRLEMVALGGDIRFAAAELYPEAESDRLIRIPVAALEEFTNQVLATSEDELVARYHVPLAETETLGPALLTYVQLAKAFDLVNVLVTTTNLREGLLRELAAASVWTEDFRRQIVRAAIDLGRQYRFDEAHARHVADVADRLFHQLQPEHKLDARFAVLLNVASLLHEIGLFISFQSHHKHSKYIIQNSEIFGLTRKDLLLTALIARYYRRATPQPAHEGYSTLDRDERVAVAKLAAILRIAVALDESRSQRIREFEVRREPGRIAISVSGVDDLSLEQLALRQSGGLFEETYGVQVLLRPRRHTP